MASTLNLVVFIADQLSSAGNIVYKKMFGEYVLYLNGKLFGSVCDDQLFIKPTKAGRALAPDCPLAPPYPGAKDNLLVENIDDREFLTTLVLATCAELPEPKKRK